MAVIQVTPELLRDKATTVRNYVKEHEDVINKITQLVNGLDEIWKGEAQTAFKTNYESMKSTFTNFAEMLESYATKLDLAANTMEETDNTLKGQMN